MDETAQKTGYGKRPLWQWILIYVVIGLIVYGIIYYFVIAKKGGYNYVPSASSSPEPMSQASASNIAPTGNIYSIKTDPTKGTYLVDFQGMTLYTYDKDTSGVSNCSGACAAAWPAYTSGATAESQLPTNITVVTRSDGSKQFAWKGMPIYYYASDQKAGDINGDGVGGVWHIVKP